MEKFITTFSTAGIAGLVADREFVGQKWFKYLRQQHIPFRIRVRQNFQVAAKKGSIPLMAIFQPLALGESLVLSRKRLILGHPLHLIGLRLEDYSKCWNIETLFGILKYCHP